MLSKILFTFLIATSLIACSGSPDTSVSSGSGSGQNTSNPYAPKPEDATLVRGAVYPGETQLLIMESAPPQIAVLVKGDLPNPCSQLRVMVTPPSLDNMITLDVYSVSDPAAICAQVLQSYEANVLLGSFPAGHYTVWVNGEQVGEFDS